MTEITWHTDTEFSVRGVRFLCSLDDYTRTTDRERIVILKDRSSLRVYQDVLKDHSLHRVLEFGILQGGSAALFSLLLTPEKFVGIDIKDRPESINTLTDRPEFARLKFYFNTSQTDDSRVRQVIETEFGHDPLDLIIDDASHQYAPTKRAFEIAYPYLRPGGLYVIDDWGWPHWKGCAAFPGEPAMSKLIFELTMICASSPRVINDVWTFSAFTFIRKPLAPSLPATLRVDELYQKRDLYLTFEDFESRLAAKTAELEAMRATRGWRMLETLRRWRARAAKCAGIRPKPVRIADSGPGPVRPSL